MNGNEIPPVDLDLVFCSMSKKYGIERHLLKAIATVESSLNPRAYRFEPAFWENYLKDNPLWKDRDPKEVSASYGLMQLMFTTAWNLGFRGSGEDLYEPVYNVELACRLIRQIESQIIPKAYFKCWPIAIICARYNGGSWKNPDQNGGLRNYQYTLKVMSAYWTIREKEKGCED